jgi:hypothetical protein
MWLLVVGFTFLQKKRKNRKLWVHKVFRAREEEGEFHTFGRLKDDRQKFYKYFRMSVSKFETLNSCSTQSLKRRTQDGDGA